MFSAMICIVECHTKFQRFWSSHLNGGERAQWSRYTGNTKFWLSHFIVLSRVHRYASFMHIQGRVAHTISAHALHWSSIVRFEQVIGSIPCLCSCNNCISSGRAQLFFANLIYGGYNWITTNRIDGWNLAAICIITSSVLHIGAKNNRYFGWRAQPIINLIAL